MFRYNGEFGLFKVWSYIMIRKWNKEIGDIFLGFVLIAIIPFLFSGCAFFDTLFSKDEVNAKVGGKGKKTIKVYREYPNSVYSKYPSRLEAEDIAYLSKTAFLDLTSSSFYSSINDRIIVAFSDFTTSNYRMKEDIEQISSKLIEFFRETKKLAITRSMGGNGVYTERLLKTVRTARNNDEYKQDSVVERENQLSAQYALRANLNVKNLNERNERKSLYLFALEMIDLSSGIIVWNKTVEITKIGI